jgi:tRNA 2-thiouridine synthesizing protein B
MLLHTVNKSFERNSLDACLRLAKAGSTVLLIEDGVYAAVQGTCLEGKLKQAMDTGINLCVLAPDLLARGFATDKVIAGINAVDYAGFVQLAADHSSVQSWL